MLAQGGVQIEDRAPLTGALGTAAFVWHAGSLDLGFAFVLILFLDQPPSSSFRRPPEGTTARRPSSAVDGRRTKEIMIFRIRDPDARVPFPR